MNAITLVLLIISIIFPTSLRGATSLYDLWIGIDHPSSAVEVNYLTTPTDGAYIKKICVWQADDYIRRISVTFSDGHTDSAGGSATGTTDCVQEAEPGECFKSYNVEWTVGRHVTRLFFADGASQIHRLGTGSTDASDIAGYQHSTQCLTAIKVDSLDKIYRISMGYDEVSALSGVKSCTGDINPLTTVTHVTFIIIVVLLCVQIVIATYLVRKNCCLNPKTMHYAKVCSSETN